MIPNCRNKQGFTIVELLIASLVLIIAIGGIIATMRTSRELQVYDLLRRQARSQLQSLLEERVTGVNYDLVASVPAQNVTLNHLQGGQISASRSLTVTPGSKTVGLVIIEVKRCTATITWTDPWNGTPQSLTLDEMVAKL